MTKVWQLTHRCVFAVSCAVLIACSNETPPPKAATAPAKDAGTPVTAYAFCKQAVTDKLKAPATAQFQSAGSATIGQYGDDTFAIESYVDAQNAYGALLRVNWTCTVTYQGRGTWRVDGFEMKPR